jgi:hypothetical protein
MDESKLLAAQKTLERMGYTYHGGEQWKPPLGQAPDFALVDRLKARLEAAEELIAAIDEYETVKIMRVSRRKSGELERAYDKRETAYAKWEDLD